MSRTSHLQIGIAAILFSAFLFFVGIPYGVTSPANVQNVVLSPVFWPYILAGLLGFGGLLLILASRTLTDGAYSRFLGDVPGALRRLVLMAVAMAAYVLATPALGMVWTSMAAFLATAFLVKTNHRKSAVAAAIFVPLLLYGFFAHVAGVAVPQGDFVRLP